MAKNEETRNVLFVVDKGYEESVIKVGVDRSVVFITQDDFLIAIGQDEIEPLIKYLRQARKVASQYDWESESK